MATRAQFRSIALRLPEAREKEHFGKPDFRVRDKIFAGLSDQEDVAWFKLECRLQVTLLNSRPDVFKAAAGAWGRSGWTYVQLAKVKAAELRRLVHDSWRAVAPKGLIPEQEGKSRLPVRALSQKPCR